MSPGSYISFALHLGFSGLVVCLTGIFPASRLRLSVADVSVVSSELFDIMVNDSSPEISTEIPSAEASLGCGGCRGSQRARGGWRSRAIGAKLDSNFNR